MEIKEIEVWTEGDPSVGIAGHDCKILATGDFICAIETQGEVEEIRGILEKAFSEIFDDEASVMFDFEISKGEPKGESNEG